MMEPSGDPTLINVDNASKEDFNETIFFDWICSYHFGVRSYPYSIGNAGRTSEHTYRH